MRLPSDTLAMRAMQLPLASRAFQTLEDYSQYFRMLLIEELRAALQSDFEEMTRADGVLPTLSLKVFRQA